MKKYILLVLLLYVFGVALRIVGQLLNGETIDWKSTLLLGELNGQEFQYDKRWFFRIGLILLLPVFWLKPLSK